MIDRARTSLSMSLFTCVSTSGAAILGLFFIIMKFVYVSPLINFELESSLNSPVVHDLTIKGTQSHGIVID